MSSCNFGRSGFCGSRRPFAVGIKTCFHLSLQVPISDEAGNVIVSEDYLRFVVGMADGKLESNFRSIERLRENVVKALTESNGGEGGEGGEVVEKDECANAED